MREKRARKFSVAAFNVSVMSMGSLPDDRVRMARQFLVCGVAL